MRVLVVLVACLWLFDIPGVLAAEAVLHEADQTKPLTIRMYLATDHTICQSQDQYELNTEDKVFAVEFSTPMDRHSVGESLKASQKEPDSLKGVMLDWKSDRVLLVRVPGSLRNVRISFPRAKGKDGRVTRDDVLAEQLSYYTGSTQTIRKLDVNGRVLKEFAIANEVLKFGSFHKSGNYAVAYRTQANEDTAPVYPYLLDLSSTTLRRFRLSDVLRGRVGDQFDSLRDDLVTYSPSMSIWPLGEILKGEPREFKPFGTEGIMTPVIDVTSYLSPSGKRCALVQTYKSRKSDARHRWPLTLLVVDRDGIVLHRVDLPVFDVSHEISGYPAPVLLRWKGEDNVLVEAFTEDAMGEPQLCVAKAPVGHQPVEILPKDFRVTTNEGLAPEREDVVKASGGQFLGAGEGFVWVLIEGGREGARK